MAEWTLTLVDGHTFPITGEVKLEVFRDVKRIRRSEIVGDPGMLSKACTEDVSVLTSPDGSKHRVTVWLQDGGFQLLGVI